MLPGDEEEGGDEAAGEDEARTGGYEDDHELAGQHHDEEEGGGGGETDGEHDHPTADLGQQLVEEHGEHRERDGHCHQTPRPEQHPLVVRLELLRLHTRVGVSVVHHLKKTVGNFSSPNFVVASNKPETTCIDARPGLGK